MDSGGGEEEEEEEEEMIMSVRLPNNNQSVRPPLWKPPSVLHTTFPFPMTMTFVTNKVIDK